MFVCILVLSTMIIFISHVTYETFFLASIQIWKVVMKLLTVSNSIDMILFTVFTLKKNLGYLCHAWDFQGEYDVIFMVICKLIL